MEEFFIFAVNFYSSDTSNERDHRVIYEDMITFLLTAFCQVKSENINRISELPVWKPLICKLVSDLGGQSPFVVDAVLKILLCITFFSSSNSIDVFLNTPIFSIFSEMIETQQINQTKIFRIINNFCLYDERFKDAVLKESQLVFRIMQAIDMTSYDQVLLEEALNTVRSILRQNPSPYLVEFCVENFGMWDVIYKKINLKMNAKCLIHIHDILKELYQIGNLYCEKHMLEDNLFVKRVIEHEELRDYLEIAQLHPEDAVYQKFYELITNYFAI